MNDETELLDLISYDETYRILKEKFNITHDELRFWIKISLDFIKSNKFVDEGETIIGIEKCFDNGLYLLFPYVSDLPTFNNCYDIPADGFFYPEYCFYNRKSVLQFIPSSHLRFVYIKDLTGKRNWIDSTRSDALMKANESGILKFYNHSLDEFSFFATRTQKWCHSFEVKEYLDNPESFFLLHEILTLERVFFGKDKNVCLNELGINPPSIHDNVIRFKKPGSKQ